VQVWCCVFSPEGTHVASASYDHTVRVWNASTGACTQVLRGHTGLVSCFHSLSPESPPNARSCVIEVLQVLCCAYFPDGAFITSSSEDNTVRLWDASTGEQLRMLEGHTDSVRSHHTRSVFVFDRIAFQLWGGVRFQVRCCEFSPPSGEQIVSGSLDKTLRIWDTSTGQCIKEMRGHTDTVWSPFICSSRGFDANKCHRCSVVRIPQMGA